MDFLALCGVALCLWAGLYRWRLPPRPVWVWLEGSVWVGLAFLLAGLVLQREGLLWRGLSLALGGLAFAWIIYAAQARARLMGEGWLWDFLRTLDYSLSLALLLGGQVALLSLAYGAESALRLVLWAMVGWGVFLGVYIDLVHRGVDAFVFQRFPPQHPLRRGRADLRAVEAALPRKPPPLDFESLPPEEFTRLTRRALSALPDLARLAASPLTDLPQIERRLTQRGADDNSLARARELQRLLTEAVDCLKPSQAEAPQASAAWRHYNVLYYPYVLGLKPAHIGRQSLSADQRPILEWLARDVPERTLHNWQNAAAKAVAAYLREGV